MVANKTKDPKRSRANEVISSTETRQLRAIVVGQQQREKNSVKNTKSNINNSNIKIPKNSKTILLCMYVGGLSQAKAFDLMRADQVRRTIVRTHN